MSRYQALCVRHYWDHRDHVDDAYVVGKYNTEKEALQHAVCWEIGENLSSGDDKYPGSYDELLVQLARLNFDSEQDVTKFQNDWDKARYDFLYDESLGCTSGYFVTISEIRENLKISEGSYAEAWNKLILGKSDEAIECFKEYSQGEGIPDYLVEYLEELGLPSIMPAPSSSKVAELYSNDISNHNPVQLSSTSSVDEKNDEHEDENHKDDKDEDDGDSY
jgi:hypothetical protein